MFGINGGAWKSISTLPDIHCPNDVVSGLGTGEDLTDCGSTENDSPNKLKSSACQTVWAWETLHEAKSICQRPNFECK